MRRKGAIAFIVYVGKSVTSGLRWHVSLDFVCIYENVK